MPTQVIETMMSELVAEGRELYANLVRSERDAAVQRVLMGRFLIKARSKMPRRARSASEGWMAFLEAIEMDDMTASRYITLAEASQSLNLRNSDDVERIPTYGDLGLTKRESPQPTDVPPPRDDDAPAEMQDHGDREGPSNLHGRNADGSGDEYCTPKKYTDALGLWDLDPCSNKRSTVQAIKTFDLELGGEDGIVLASKVDAKTKTFINPPYSDVMPWVEAYAHVRFCFLLKFDPSTKWFHELIENSELILIPKERIAFIKVDGEEAQAVAFPHAFYFAKAKDAPKALRDLCFRWDLA